MMHDPQLDQLRAQLPRHDADADMIEEILDALGLMKWGAVAGAIVAIVLTAPGWVPTLLQAVLP